MHDHTQGCVSTMIVLLHDRVDYCIFTQISAGTLDFGAINEVSENTGDGPTLSCSGLKDLKAI